MRFLSEPAARIRRLSAQHAGDFPPLEMIGHSPAFVETLTKLEKVATYPESLLITGESGVGKEQFARAIHLLGCPDGPYVPVNCPQYQDGNVTVSELFGHTKGSFTGAVRNHRGAFEQADSGVLFLDEIADLHSSAQALLLRALSTGEIRPLGDTKTRIANTRVVSATNRPLNQLVMGGSFRYDLFFRLRHFHLAVPPLRERDDDWRLLLDFSLERLRRRYGEAKKFSDDALEILSRYDWPGNVRQLIGVVATGYALADDNLIRPRDLESLVEGPDSPPQRVNSRYDRVVQGGEDFWEIIHQPFLNRDLNRTQLRGIVRAGLAASGGSYRRLLERLHLPQKDYQRFMDFLRHHDLKP